MKATRKMVAQKAGVSKESVSYVLNKSRPVSKEIVEKVMKAVEELGYVPDVMARTLSNKRSNSIGVICNDLSNPYYGDIIYGIELAADEKGISIIVADAKKNISKNILDMVSRRVDGICFLVFPDKFNFDYSGVYNANINFVVTHNTAFNDKNIPHIEPNFEMGIRETLEYLKASGHKDVAMLSAFDEKVDFDNRRFYFDKNYKELFGIEPAIVSLTSNFRSTLDSGRMLAQRFVSRGLKSTAILCTNDLMAIGAIQYFKENNIKVPEDISVIGIDDMMFSSIVTPGLSTIGYDKRAYGEALFDSLYKNIIDGTITNTLIPLKFIARDSVKKIY